ncbi:MAG: N-acetylglucosamine-6-phosphate deacetylase, partial [Lactobacillus iners]|nr:N-acetylglucosamine-6-phosphate deacetylase [Lactobacillus iners]
KYCGVIEPDHPADFIILNSDLTLVETYVNGISRYKND